MPIVECGFPLGPVGAAQLARVGPTIQVDIGFNPAMLAQVPGLAALAGTSPPIPPALPSPGKQSPPTPAQAVAMAAAMASAAAGQQSLIQNVPALIDTGAHISCIDETLAQQLHLPLINEVDSGGVHGQGKLNVYLAYISIPQLGTTQAGGFIGAKMAQGNQPHRALIGRTLLRDTLLVYDGRSGSVKIAR